ncbi:hypothetical protein [Actinoplanes regularis]|uniref:Uncharacterized protein n=1 Tax=Actinoplanes regularis TaxID=52697 RepID=A0A238YVK1_9ACTN|nr:hypothetical protein [Actinoplanes regularis]GIE85599.1 hypothetical protein Are01nite_20790 [Actinoplanes regularis]SNR75157.1 hypothetical protein SAMN06264365_105219 [Actinoplanes regularis]
MSDLAVACGGVVTTTTTRARTKRPHCDPNLQDGIVIGERRPGEFSPVDTLSIVRLPLVASAVVTVAYLAVYLILSIVYHRRWDSPIRAALGRRLGTRVGWRHHAQWADPFSNEVSGGYHGWGAGPDSSLGRQLAVNLAHLAVLVVIGVGPIALYLLVAFTGVIHPVVLWLAVFAFLPIFALFWAGRYRWDRD